MQDDPIVEAVIHKMRDRSFAGQVKYGTTLMRTDINIVGWLTHLQEELMDACLYLERVKMEITDTLPTGVGSGDRPQTSSPHPTR